jgi:RimJ/RimL family protein N-acetyltransferase
MKPILLNLPEQFDTERLIISIYENGDGEEFFRLLQANYDHLLEELPETRTIGTVDGAEEYVRIKRVAWLSRERLVAKVVEKSTGKMIGQLWIEPKWDRLIFEIGYFVVENRQGRGYITEAVRRMVAYLFNELGATRLEIHTKATNLRSIRIAERCGFTQEARLRQRTRTNEGFVVDVVIFGLLRSEYH